MSKYHSSLTDADGIHEPKNITGSTSGYVYISNGNGTGTWGKAEELGDTKADSFLLNNTVWNDLRIPLTSAKVPGTGGATLTQINDDGAGSIGVFTYSFASGTENSLYFTAQLPHSLKAGTTIRPHLHWAPSDNTVGDVVWGLEYCFSNYGLGMNNTSTITVTDSSPQVTNEQSIANFPDIVSSSEGTSDHIKESTIIIARLYRDATNGSDTYAAGAFALSFDFHIKLEKIGSIVEIP